MKRLFVLTPDAKNDLKDILLNVAEDDPDAAERLRTKSLLACRGWLDRRESAISTRNFLSRKYRFWNFYSYAIAYVWAAKPIQIVSVIHGARDLNAFFAKRPYLHE